jgi:hypothetical protein
MIEPFLPRLVAEKTLGIKVWLQRVLCWGGLLWQQWFWLHCQFGFVRLSQLQSLQSKIFK